MTATHRQSNVAILCALVILVVSYGFTFYTLSTPERMKIFNYVMFIPAPIAFCFFLYETRSFSAVFKPIATIPKLGSLGFAFLFPVLFLGIVSLAVLGLGLGSLSSTAFPKIMNSLPKGAGWYVLRGIEGTVTEVSSVDIDHSH
jgi:hypothetical protein